jgi:hypothetical protein
MELFYSIYGLMNDPSLIVRANLQNQTGSHNDEEACKQEIGDGV